jgi:uncharacterized membrane protein
MPSQTRASSGRSFFQGWRLPVALLVLGAIPLVAGTARLAGLVARVPVTPENARFFDSPIPVFLHVVGAIAFSVLGAFQLAPDLRRRHPGWHRAAGRMASIGGVAAGLSGLWMALFYPPQAQDGRVLLILRLFFGTGLVLCLAFGWHAAHRRRLARHGTWMVRAYAIGMGAGTQAVLHLPWAFMAATPGRASRAFLMGAGWVINLLAAEWLLTRRTGSSRTGAGRRRQTCSDSHSRPVGQSR